MNAETPIVSAGALPASTKIYAQGNLHKNIRVPMREISVHPTAGEPPLRVYDSSGPYTDHNFTSNIAAGLPRVRESWIMGRGDVEVYQGRAVRPEDNGDVSADTPHSFRHMIVSQMYARGLSIAEFKAWSQNLGHEGAMTTLTSYGRISLEEQGKLVRGAKKPDQEADLIAQIRLLVAVKKQG